MDLQKRVDRLERENRKLKHMGFVAVLLIAVATSLGFVQNQEDVQMLKNRQAQMRLGILKQITQGQDTAPIMQQLITNAKNGDTEATRTLLDIIFRGELN